MGAEQNCAFMGTGTSHDGQVVAASADFKASVFVNRIPIAHVGDIVDCDDEPIITGSTTVMAQGRFVARLGDAAECEAVLTPPVSGNVLVG